MTAYSQAAGDGLPDGVNAPGEGASSPAGATAVAARQPERQPGVTVGAGLTRPQGRYQPLADWTPQTVADALGKLSGVEAWWSAHHFDGDYRLEANWQAAALLALDLDYHDAAGEHAAMPADMRERLHAVDLPGNLYHDTPRGARLVAVLAQPVTDADEYSRAVEGFAAQVRASLDAAGLLGAGLDVDPAALDRARLLYAPCATVKGATRNARVVVLNQTMSRAADWRAPEPAAEPAPRDGREPLPPVPLDAFPPAVADYIQAVAENRCVDPAMPATFALGMAAAAVGRAAEIEVRPGWRECPVLWLGHVAPPGKLKSPTLKTMAAPLYDHDDELAERYEIALTAWEAECELARKNKEKPPERPRRGQAVVGDVTIEALGDVLEISPRVAGVYDELGAMFDAMGAYKKSGGHDRQAYLSLHAGVRIVVNRKGKDPLIVPDPRLTVIGATTPSTCARVLGTLNGDGMVDRFFLTASEPRRNRFRTPPVPPELRDAYAASIAALCNLPTREPRVLALTPEAADAFGDFYESLDPAAVPPHFQGVLGKLAGHVARIALVLTLWRDPQAEAVPRDVVEAAIRLGEWLCEHTADARSAQTVTPEAARLVEWLRKQGGRACLRDVYRNNAGGAKTEAEATALCNELVSARLAVWGTRDTTAGNEKREIILTGGDE